MKYPSPKKLMEVIERVLDQRIAKETLLKDIRAMKKSADLGFDAPIKYSRSHRGYYYDDPNYTIKKFPVEYEEIESAQFALTLLNQSGALPYLNRFKNFIERAVTFAQVENQLKGDLSEYIKFEEPVEVEGLTWIQPLVNAIELKKVIVITYRSISGQSTKTRRLHPYLLKEYDDRWYVYGFDEETEEERIFGLDRIQDLETDKGGEYRYFSGDREEIFKHTLGVSRFVGDPQEIILQFFYPQSEYILTKPIHDSQEVIDQDDESITIKLYLRINYELRALIRSYGDQVEVLKPTPLK
ncbi:WYL domain-containing protein [Aliifodinibius halophilus]|uniref:WYL domain-containing protein n=2 Tax=Fodinibius halophilus TaxID=1736908 RepID=A0A6M1T6G6_9BACT|nr:WYL domain-containing protein [Fodinibius halophilus]